MSLVTVAQALHWFDAGAFFAEARRVLAPGGALAAWSYGDPTLGDPALDAVLRAYARGTLGPWWPAERRLVDEGYRSIDFPFREVEAPAFTLEHAWTLAELAGYLRSWSATLRLQAAAGGDPVAAVEAALRPLWGAPDARRAVRWPVSMRAGHAGA